ncbi:hypothetical protein ASE17_18555 [Phenylobacterium sp. Root77]|jgi:hypothetical protein|uniref:hypothetical protein n=1 Tax=unclassified Phenylobacterium TaxID=2640670 RepID=UPI0006F364F6|nr:MULTISPECIES: hypothetical protein [unclassified Phenylobacterium]KQW70861.1 hypothetical protein ASC73_12425 [Phenylobacterium sp. Root1277]KQW90718.1 hypothetical protein ASC79_15165 [Phenylobacterium sp. Root1290]KRC39650.1 hypothetical protein ASE17_18555 [Phenylobacterium sp. Root77]
MTIINFPTHSLRSQHTAAEKARILIALVTGIRSLGEPATADELVEFTRGRITGMDSVRLKAGIDALLREYAEPAPAEPFAHAPFRRVLLGRTEAWAFSKPFRTELANSGLEVRLRPIPDA